MVGNWFLRFGALFGLAGVGLSIYIGYQHDLKLAPLQSPVNLVAWISFFLAGLFYSSISTTSEYVETIGSRLPVSAGLHLLVALVGVIVLVGGTFGQIFNLTFTGNIGGQAFDNFAWGEPAVQAGTITTGVAQLLFFLNVLRGTS